MIKHIVIWRIDGKEENAARIKTELEALKGRIDGLYDIEVGININPSDVAYDVALYSVFESQEALDAYQVNPMHVRAAEFIRTVAKERHVVDYEQ